MSHGDKDSLQTVQPWCTCSERHFRSQKLLHRIHIYKSPLCQGGLLSQVHIHQLASQWGRSTMSQGGPTSDYIFQKTTPHSEMNKEKCSVDHLQPLHWPLPWAIAMFFMACNSHLGQMLFRVRIDSPSYSLTWILPM